VNSTTHKLIIRFVKHKSSIQALTIDWQYGSVEMKHKPKVPPTPPYIGEKDELLQLFHLSLIIIIIR